MMETALLPIAGIAFFVLMLGLVAGVARRASGGDPAGEGTSSVNLDPAISRKCTQINADETNPDETQHWMILGSDRLVDAPNSAIH